MINFEKGLIGMVKCKMPDFESHGLWQVTYILCALFSSPMVLSIS
jgi:hypothetical protein